MEKLSNRIFQKAEDVLFGDKLKVPTEVNNIVSSEMLYILAQYFDVKKDSYKSSVFIEKNGELNVYFSFKANRVLMKKR